MFTVVFNVVVFCDWNTDKLPKIEIFPPMFTFPFIDVSPLTNTSPFNDASPATFNTSLNVVALVTFSSPDTSKLSWTYVDPLIVTLSFNVVVEDTWKEPDTSKLLVGFSTLIPTFPSVFVTISFWMVSDSLDTWSCPFWNDNCPSLLGSLLTK